MPSPPPTATRGFTLIEILVVLTILGISFAGISLSLNILHQRDVDTALERLRWVLEASAERAQILGQPLALDLLSDGYRFSALDTDGRWIAFEEPPIFVEKQLPDSLRWQALRTAKGRSQKLIFGLRSPRYELEINTPDGLRTLSGRSNGEVKLLVQHQDGKP